MSEPRRANQQAEGARCDVVVVGAGYAGLQTARRLATAGVDVLALEARPRVGGRVWTETTPSGAVVDHGGQWLGPGQQRLAALADELGVATFPTWTTGAAVEVRAGTRHTYTGLVPTSDPEAAAAGIEAILDLDLAALEVPLDEPWAAAGAQELDSRTLGSWAEATIGSPAARAVLAAAVQGVFGAEPGELSLLFTQFYLHAGGGLLNLARTTGGAQERRFAGGAQQMACRLAEQLGDRVLLGHPVVAVSHGPSGVTVTASGPRGPVEVHAGRAVLAMPPAVTARIHFDPPLPGNRQQLVQRAPMGAVTKVHAVYERPFWRDEGLNGQLVADEGAARLTFDDSPEDGSHGVLLAFVAGNECRRLDGAGAEGRCTAVLADLVRAFGPAAGRPVEVVEQHWPAEPYTGGGPVAVLPPGTLTGVGPALRAPVGRLHWAGTETALEWTGYIDGALSSGDRAADEVLAAETRSAPEGDPTGRRRHDGHP